MALNPFFLQGSQSEQRLVQDIINEQLTIYGVEVTYIPRKVVNKKTIFREVTASRFDDNYLLEAYVNTYEGYDGQGDIMTKFGVSLKDELLLTISKERFEDFIAPFMSGDSEITVATRPEEGDLVYFPLGQRLFEVKFVEHEKPFYQLGKNYVYQLQCELFEYEDEVIDTSISEIDETIEDQGFATNLVLFSVGTTAVGTATTTGADSGYVRKLWLNNDGYGYTKNPTVAISNSPSGDHARAVAITTSVNNVYSVKELLLTHVGSGYTTVPTVNIVSAATTATNGVTTYHGVGAAATASIVTSGVGIATVGFTTVGAGYSFAPSVSFGTPSGGAGSFSASGTAYINSSGILTSVLLIDAGIGYTAGTSTVSFSASDSVTGVGTYQYNEIVTGGYSGTTGRVKSWDIDTRVLVVGNESGVFQRGETLVGSASSAKYSIESVPEGENLDKYDQNTDIETEADLILDFSESNPFGGV
tara:strand:- start:438 stop:1859 length:1422 start_codon:yes stop_codon:yes gene_type:complete